MGRLCPAWGGQGCRAAVGPRPAQGPVRQDAWSERAAPTHQLDSRLAVAQATSAPQARTQGQGVPPASALWAPAASGPLGEPGGLVPPCGVWPRSAEG